MSGRPRHTDKDTERVLREAEAAGWTLDYPRGHWGWLLCPHHGQDRCRIVVSGTPRGSSQFKRLRREVNKCPHDGG